MTILQKTGNFLLQILKERKYWDEYQNCYEEAIGETNTKYAPWYVLPSDNKWYARLLMSEVIVKTLESLDLKYPAMSSDQLKMLDLSRKALLKE